MEVDVDRAKAGGGEGEVDRAGEVEGGEKLSVPERQEKVFGTFQNAVPGPSVRNSREW